TLRYVYISPISYYVYILGRAFSKILVSIFGVLITLGFGFFFLHVDMRFTPDRIPLFIVSLALGLFVLLAIGITLGAATFLMARHSQTLAEAVPGVFYVFCGVLFPFTILPSWGQSNGTVSPLTHPRPRPMRTRAVTLGRRNARHFLQKDRLNNAGTRTL